MSTVSKCVVVAGALGALALSACVTKPYDEYVGGLSLGEPYFVGTPSEFEGWASQGNATIILEIQHKVTLDWREVTRTTSNGAGFNFGGEELHFWEIDVDLGTVGIPDLPCYFNTSCIGTRGWATLRVREPGGKSATLVTHRKNGVDCTIDGVQDGLSLANAYLGCDPPDAYTELRVFFH